MPLLCKVVDSFRSVLLACAERTTVRTDRTTVRTDRTCRASPCVFLEATMADRARFGAAREPHFVRSFERGLAVIRAFDAEHPALTLSEVARTCELTRAAARRFAESCRLVRPPFAESWISADFDDQSPRLGERTGVRRR